MIYEQPNIYYHLKTSELTLINIRSGHMAAKAFG